MPKFTRVRDTETGLEFSTRHPMEHHDVLDERAVDHHGRPLPGTAPKSSGSKAAKPATAKSGQKEESK